MRPPHLRRVAPAPDLLAWYDGRVPGYRLDPAPNWVDDGAISLGTASYALVRGNRALVYDAHVTLDHARAVRADLAGLGVTDFTLVLSHRHLDHIAGNAAFADGPVLANTATEAHLIRDRAAIEAGTLNGPPAIAPLILPDRSFADRLDLSFGGLEVQALRFDIHSDDATVLWLPERRLLLAGDTLEDPLTYVTEPARLAAHLADLDRLAALGATRILPNHGDPDIIAAGGYGPGLIDATRTYTRWLRDLPGASRPRRHAGDDHSGRASGGRRYPLVRRICRRAPAQCRGGSGRHPQCLSSRRSTCPTTAG